MCHSAGLGLGVGGVVVSSQTLAFGIDRLIQSRPVCVEMHNLVELPVVAPRPTMGCPLPLP